MEKNENIVMIQTENKQIQRKILEFVSGKIGITETTVVTTLEPFCIKGSINNESIIAIIKLIILEGWLDIVAIKPIDTPKNTIEKETKRCEWQKSKEEEIIDINEIAKREIQILNLFKTTTCKMTQEQIVTRVKVSPKIVAKVLDFLIESKELRKERKNYMLYDFPFGIFEKSRYKILLDYIMQQDNFTELQIKTEFPKEFYKLPELLNQMQGKYITGGKNNITKSYHTYSKARVLYYIRSHPNIKFPDVMRQFPSIGNRKMSSIIFHCISDGQLWRKETGELVVLKM